MTSVFRLQTSKTAKNKIKVGILDSSVSRLKNLKT